MKKIYYFINNLFSLFGFEIKFYRLTNRSYESESLPKAKHTLDRFREIVSDPINFLIERVPNSGFIDEKNFVVLHNGIRVPIQGEFAYYNNFSDILIINRGVHEPLEEFCFQEVLKNINLSNPVMIELGAYWAHYSMWFQKVHAGAVQFLIEPDMINIRSGLNNFKINGFHGEFINKSVGYNGFVLDDFVTERKLRQIDLLHSDIQGYELEMLEGAIQSLSSGIVKYLFLSTHSEKIHSEAISFLGKFNYRIEVSSNVDSHTTSSDGFILATSLDVIPVFTNFKPLGRVEICNSNSNTLVSSLSL